VDEFKSRLAQFKDEAKAARKENESAIGALHGGVHNCEQILAFCLAHDREMKQKYSRAKMHWIRAINKVVMRNFLAKVVIISSLSLSSLFL
jgi:hypothetical protein